MADRRAARPPALQCATSEARPSIKHNHEALQDSQLTESKEAQATATQTEGPLVVRIGVYLQDARTYKTRAPDAPTVGACARTVGACENGGRVRLPL